MNTTIDIMHYAGGGLVLILGLLAFAGVHLPGVEINPAIAIPGGIGILGAGLKAAARAVDTPAK